MLLFGIEPLIAVFDEFRNSREAAKLAALNEADL
jgi:hypothetical protein